MRFDRCPRPRAHPASQSPRGSRVPVRVPGHRTRSPGSLSVTASHARPQRAPRAQPRLVLGSLPSGWAAGRRRRAVRAGAGPRTARTSRSAPAAQRPPPSFPSRPCCLRLDTSVFEQGFNQTPVQVASIFPSAPCRRGVVVAPNSRSLTASEAACRETGRNKAPSA